MLTYKHKGKNRKKNKSDENFVVEIPEVYANIGLLAVFAVTVLMIIFTFSPERRPRFFFYVLCALFLWGGMHLVIKAWAFRVVVQNDRLIIGCMFLVCSIIAIKNSKAIRKHILYIVFISLSGIWVVVSAFLPFENLFVTFDSSQAAYAYLNLGKSNIELIVEGNDSDFIVARKSDTDTYRILPKTADGWKIGIGVNTKRIVQKLSNGIVLYVYQYKNTSDYFITILDTNGGEATISDEYNTKFLALERSNAALGKTFVTYYAHITNLNPQYSVMVNGNQIVLENP